MTINAHNSRNRTSIPSSRPIRLHGHVSFRMFNRLGHALSIATRPGSTKELRNVYWASRRLTTKSAKGGPPHTRVGVVRPAPHSAETRTPTTGGGAAWSNIIFWSLNLFLIFHLLGEHVCTLRRTSGPSMLPTINVEGDWVFISKYHRRGRGVAVGDIVSYEHPMRRGYRAVKRIVAMPGDFVLRDTPGRGEWVVQVPEGHCWVAGDNLEWSRDSRHFGPLPLALLKGKVLFKISTQGWNLWGNTTVLGSTLRDVE